MVSDGDNHTSHSPHSNGSLNGHLHGPPQGPGTPPQPLPTPLLTESEQAVVDRAGLLTVPPEVDPWSPERMAQRAVQAVRATALGEQQEQTRRRIRPMCETSLEAHEADFRVNRDTKARFRFTEPVTGFEPIAARNDDYAYETTTTQDGRQIRRKRTQEEIQRFIRQQVLEKAYRERDYSLEDLTPFRIAVAYRVVRDMARLRGLLLPEERLADVLVPEIDGMDPWLAPRPWASRADNENAVLASTNRRTQFTDCIDIIIAAEGCREDLRYREWSYTEPVGWRTAPGIGLLPPPVPPRWLDAHGEITDDYDPGKDKPLCYFAALIEATANHLGIPAGSQEDPDAGRYGLMGLIQPHWVRLCFPTRLQIVAYESMIVEEMLDALVTTSPRKARLRMNRKFGLIDHEIQALTKQARVLAIDLAAIDPEDARALTLLRLEEFVERSREAINTRDELAGIKQISLVLGLTKEKPEDMMEGLVDAMKQIAVSRREKYGALAAERKQVVNELE